MEYGHTIRGVSGALYLQSAPAGVICQIEDIVCVAASLLSR